MKGNCEASGRLTERLLELVQCVGDQLSLGGVLRVLTNAVEHHRYLGAALHRRDEQVGQLQASTAGILLTPLQHRHTNTQN